MSQAHWTEKYCHLVFVAGCTTVMEGGLSSPPFATGGVKCENDDFVASCSLVRKFRGLEGTRCLLLDSSNVITLKAEAELPTKP
jgi:hypothetical protein